MAMNANYDPFQANASEINKFLADELKNLSFEQREAMHEVKLTDRSLLIVTLVLVPHIVAIIFVFRTVECNGVIAAHFDCCVIQAKQNEETSSD